MGDIISCYAGHKWGMPIQTQIAGHLEKTKLPNHTITYIIMYIYICIYIYKIYYIYNIYIYNYIYIYMYNIYIYTYTYIIYIPMILLLVFLLPPKPPTSSIDVRHGNVASCPSEGSRRRLRRFWAKASSVRVHCVAPTYKWQVNGNSRILKWRYVSSIFLAIFCGDIP